MRNTKELKPILTALYCINQCGANDIDIRTLCEYVFIRIFEGSANILALCCAGKTKEDILLELEPVLKDTKYKEYKEMRDEHRRQ